MPDKVPPKPRRMTAEELRVDRAEHLARATDLLSSRVAALADAVQINNHKIDQLRKEVNLKPDDVEVKLITGLAQAERARHLKFAVGTALTCAGVAGGIAFYASDSLSDAQHTERVRVGYEACLASNERTLVNSSVFRDVADILPEGEAKERILSGATTLDTTLRDCETIYPKEQR